LLIGAMMAILSWLPVVAGLEEGGKEEADPPCTVVEVTEEPPDLLLLPHAPPTVVARAMTARSPQRLLLSTNLPIVTGPPYRR
jgi:hypothetical protein